MFLDLEKGGWNSSSSSVCVCVCVCVCARARVRGGRREGASYVHDANKEKKNRKVKCNCQGDVDFGPESIWKDIYIYIYIFIYIYIYIFI